MARSASDVAEIDEIQKTDYICTSKESERPAPDTLDETLPMSFYPNETDLAKGGLVSRSTLLPKKGEIMAMYIF